MAVEEQPAASEAEAQAETEDTAVLPKGMAGPTPEQRALGEEARRELEARGLVVVVDTKWWGFQVHMDKPTAEQVALIEEQVGKIVGAVIPKYGKLVAKVMKLHAKAIKLANSKGSYGVTCSSPWIAPGWLVPTPRKAPSQDTSLWWTVFQPSEDRWNDDEKFTAHHSGSNPALAEFQGKLYLVHRGHGDGDNQLWWAVYDPETGWGDDQKFPAHSTAAGPALAVFNGKLHCVHRGSGNDTRLWHTTFDGSSWSRDSPLPAHSSSVGPAIAVFGGKLHCVHKGATSDSQLWHTTFDGNSWSRDTKLPAHSTASNPALAEFRGQLHLVHRGSANDTRLWHATFDGTRWSQDSPLPAHSSLEGPGLAVFDGKLYCVHRGHGSADQNLWWTTYRPFINNIFAWSDDRKFHGHTSGAGPAVLAYRDKNAEADQLLVVHRGYGNKAAGTDAAEVEAQIAAEELAATQPDTD